MQDLLQNAWHAGYSDFEIGEDRTEEMQSEGGTVAANEYLCGRSAARDDYEGRE